MPDRSLAESRPSGHVCRANWTLDNMSPHSLGLNLHPLVPPPLKYLKVQRKLTGLKLTKHSLYSSSDLGGVG